MVRRKKSPQRGGNSGLIRPVAFFPFELRTTNYTSKSEYRVLGSEIDVRWFNADGSIDAPEGAIEFDKAVVSPFRQVDAFGRVDPMRGATGDIERYLQSRYPMKPWQFGAVLAVCIAIGFGCLFIWNRIRRRRKVG